MAKYRKKPVVIEAIQFQDDAEVIAQLSELIGKDISINYNEPDNPKIFIHTLEGVMRADVGDYIIKGVAGEFYPCKSDIFEQTYEDAE